MLVSPIPPFLLQATDNPEGLPASLFDGFMAAAQKDAPRVPCYAAGVCSKAAGQAGTVDRRSAVEPR